MRISECCPRDVAHPAQAASTLGVDGSDRGLNSGLGHIGCDTKKFFLPIERGPQKGKVCSNASKNKTPQDDCRAREPCLPGHVNIYLSANEDEEQELRKNPQFLQFLRYDVSYWFRFFQYDKANGHDA